MGRRKKTEKKKLRSIKVNSVWGGEMIHVIDVGCWQAEMYGYGCWLEAIKRKTAVGDRIKFVKTFTVSCNDYVCKMQTGKR